MTDTCNGSKKVKDMPRTPDVAEPDETIWTIALWTWSSGFSWQDRWETKLGFRISTVCQDICPKEIFPLGLMCPMAKWVRHLMSSIVWRSKRDGRTPPRRIFQPPLQKLPSLMFNYTSHTWSLCALHNIHESHVKNKIQLLKNPPSRGNLVSLCYLFFLYKYIHC